MPSPFAALTAERKVVGPMIIMRLRRSRRFTRRSSRRTTLRPSHKTSRKLAGQKKTHHIRPIQSVRSSQEDDTAGEPLLQARLEREIVLTSCSVGGFASGIRIEPDPNYARILASFLSLRDTE